MSKEIPTGSPGDIMEENKNVEPSIEAIGLRAKDALDKVIPELERQKSEVEAQISALEKQRTALAEKLNRAKHNSEFMYVPILLNNNRRVGGNVPSGPLVNESYREINSVLDENGLSEFALPLLDESAFPG